MNIHINKSVNKRIKKGEINIDIEVAENTENLKDIVEYIEAFDKRKIVVHDGDNMI